MSTSPKPFALSLEDTQLLVRFMDAADGLPLSPSTFSTADVARLKTLLASMKAVLPRISAPAAKTGLQEVVACDGAAPNNQLGREGGGVTVGFAAVFADGREFADFERGSTNNRAEQRAALLSLAHATSGSNLVIQTDSQYVVETMRGAFKRKTNHDLWLELDRAVDRHKATGGTVTFEKVKGHSGHPLNERADALAVQAARAGG